MVMTCVNVRSRLLDILDSGQREKKLKKYGREAKLVFQRLMFPIFLYCGMGASSTLSTLPKIQCWFWVTACLFYLVVFLSTSTSFFFSFLSFFQLRLFGYYPKSFLYTLLANKKMQSAMEDDKWSMHGHTQNQSNRPEMNDPYYQAYSPYPNVVHSNAM